MNMEQQRKRKHWQKNVHHKKFVINTLIYIRKSMNGFNWNSIFSDEHQHQNKLSMCKRISIDFNEIFKYRIAQDIFWKLYRRNLIFQETVKQLYCNTCER